MNSLRTDDIIGAIPRVRHMPKNLFRERNYPQYQEANMTRNSLPGSIPYHNLQTKYPYNQNFYPNFPLSQYDPIPFIPVTKQNQNASTNRYQNSSYYHVNRGSSPKIIKKEALFTNYDQISELQKMKANYQQRRSQSPMQTSYQDNINSPRQVSYNERQSNPQNKTVDLKATVQFVQNQKRNSSRGSQKQQKIDKSVNLQQNLKIAQRVLSPSSSNSVQNKKQRSNYFRGLGFNIITNKKFQYDVQTRLDPTFLQRQKECQ